MRRTRISPTKLNLPKILGKRFQPCVSQNLTSPLYRDTAMGELLYLRTVRLRETQVGRTRYRGWHITFGTSGYGKKRRGLLVVLFPTRGNSPLGVVIYSALGARRHTFLRRETVCSHPCVRVIWYEGEK